MYAIVDIAGQQFKVEKDQKIFVNRLEGEEGSKIDFDQIFLTDNDGEVQVGAPVVSNMVVKATILSHLRGDTVKVFKKKRRKGYQKLNGHRQYLTQIQIDSIVEGKAEKKVVAKTTPKKDDTTAVVEKPVKAATAPKAENETAAKPAKKEAEKKATKSPAVKKTVAPKKAAAKKPAKKKEE